MRSHIAFGLLAIPLVGLVATSCSTPESLGRGFVPDGGSSESFTDPDASSVAPDSGLATYCASSSCSAPFMTCAASVFPCDINVMTDPSNCGSCGFVCNPPNLPEGLRFDCVAGRCEMHCAPRTADCNGIIDDGCEVQFGSNDHCDHCGDVCPEPDTKPCVYDPIAKLGQCGCPAGTALCHRQCVDLSGADDDCGSCGIACDPGGHGAPPLTNAYYGCVGTICEKPKCNQDYADCDGTMSNGCETYLVTATDCGACGKACGAGQECVSVPQSDGTHKSECLCPPGLKRCGLRCVDLTTDLGNCGGCGVDCTVENANHGKGYCAYGSCGSTCAVGWADCNGDPKDGCETNLDSDQYNCGSCGSTCDLLAGQPCIAGKCAVVPCGTEEGPTR